MKDWHTVEPDFYRLMNKHFTPGRAGNQIKTIVRHHNAGTNLSTADVWNIWQSREASAHYQIEVDGRIGQLVNDWDTAWHAASPAINSTSIGLEHANTGGPPGWPISNATIINGARLAAALCKAYGLGRPKYGANIRDHREFTATSCPHALAPGGPYHDQWMTEAGRFYDELTSGPKPPPLPTTPAPNPHPREDDDMNADQSRQLAENNAQLTGSHVPGEFPGWPQLGGRTIVDALAEVGKAMGLDGFAPPKR